MIKRLAATFAFLLVLLLSAFPTDSLLLHSLEVSTYEELVHMSRAFGLDSSLEESELRSALIVHFGLENEVSTIENTTEVSATMISIDSCDSLYSSSDNVIMAGNVSISFVSEGSSAKRTLVAQKVIVDFSSKRIEALGDVSLKDSSQKDRTFEGQAIVLDWGSLDIVVFDGENTSARPNSNGTQVMFFASGDRISYAGESNSILFRNGTIATTDDDPLWSIEAKKLVFAESDVFIDNAIFKLGRVPIFYIPVFFYPGTTLAFNPAMGMSSSKGAFLNTTFELFGRYPGLGSNGEKKDDEEDFSASITSFLSNTSDSEMVRDGIYYRALKDGEELGELESWARKSSSYMAVFADVYEKLGLVLGFDTTIKSKSFTFKSTGAVGYRATAPDTSLQNFRFAFDANVSYKGNGLELNVKLPFISDPHVKADYLNRNSAFTLDSVFGSEQAFPTTYTTQNTYSASFDAKYSKSLGSYSINISSLKADIDYKFEKTVDGYERVVTEASFPYLSLSSNGVFIDLKGKSQETEEVLSYENEMASSFEAQRQDLDGDPVFEGPSEELPYMEGPALDLTKKSSSSGATFKAGYTFSQSLDNVYKTDLVHDKFYTKANGTLYVKTNAPDSWLTVSETLKPDFSFSDNDIEKGPVNRTETFALGSSLEVGSPKLGITYTLSQNIYTFKNQIRGSVTETTDKWGEWRKEDISAHNLNFNRSLGMFSLGMYLQFKPLVEIIRPSAGISSNGFRLSSSFSFERKDEKFEKGTGKLDLSYSSSAFSISFANSYDFKVLETGSDPWDGYGLVQKLTLKPVSGLVLSQDSKLEKQFKVSTLKFSASYDVDSDLLDLKTQASISFKGTELEKDVFNVKLSANTQKIKLWKNRIQSSVNTDLSFKYDFTNPYQSVLTASLKFNFSIAEFLDLSLNVSSSNKSFYRYYNDSGLFVLEDMVKDLLKSFDFFGEGRRSTAFNLSNFKVQAVHYMQDWNLYIDAEGKLTTQYSGKYEWVPQVTVYVKWNALPELKVESSWNSYEREWK